MPTGIAPSIRRRPATNPRMSGEQKRCAAKQRSYGRPVTRAWLNCSRLNKRHRRRDRGAPESLFGPCSFARHKPRTAWHRLEIVVAEVVISRRHPRPGSRIRQRRGSVAIAVVAVAGGASWVFGRSNSPLCEPDSWYQLHGLWHMLSAIVFALWYWWAIADVQD